MKDPNHILMQTSWFAVDTTSSAPISRRVFQANFQVKDIEQDDLETLSGKGFMTAMKKFFDKKKVEQSL